MVKNFALSEFWNSVEIYSEGAAPFLDLQLDSQFNKFVELVWQKDII